MASCCTPKPVLICSRTVTQILLWSTLISIFFSTANIAWPIVTNVADERGHLWSVAIVYSILTLFFVVFPLGGVLGDAYWGRYKAVVTGKILICVSMASILVVSLVLVFCYYDDISHLSIGVDVVLGVSLLLFFSGLAMFCSNIIQFGLDQLLDKPCESQGVFVHWLLWAVQIGTIIVEIVYAFSRCFPGRVFSYLLYSTPLIYLLLLVFFLVLTYFTKGSFNRGRVKYNPYKMIFKVFNFARKHKYPVGPVSAFTRCYNYRPSRLDYAKERYGGPFSPADVEDVKAFKRVFFLLLTTGFNFVADLPNSNYFSSMFVKHLGESFYSTNKTCGSHFTVEIISRTTTAVLFPLYLWLIYCVLRNRTPKILHRLVLGILLRLLSVASMFVIDLTGHFLLPTIHPSECVFVHTNATLNLPWSISIFPSVLNSFGFFLVIATTMEFISAQSPHTMQGVLVGTFLCVGGLFHAFGTVLLVPFALKRIWTEGYLAQHPPVFSCGSGYYLVCVSVALIGLVSLLVAVRRYKYRRRDEDPYSQACVEEIYARIIERRIQHDQYEELAGVNRY